MSRWRPGRASAVLLLATAVTNCGCAVARYADDLRSRTAGRTLFVQTPAHLGGYTGFVLGLPVSVVLLPVTYPAYRLQRASNEAAADPWTSLLLPSFVLQQTGTLVAVPFDLIEYAVYRAWRGPQAMTREDRERIELQRDREILPSYPVEPVYPPG